VKEAARQSMDGGVVVRRALVLIAAVVTLAAIGTVLAIGSNMFQKRATVILETPTVTAVSSPTTRPGQGPWVFHTNAAGPALRVDYALPDGIELLVERDPRYLSFTDGPQTYGFSPAGEGRPDGRGIRIIDVAAVRPHFNHGLPLGVDAASFMDGLATNQVVGGSIGPVQPTILGGLPGLTGDLLPAAKRIHMDAFGPATQQGILQVDLWSPSRLIVANVDTAIVLVQIWADSEAAMASWLEASQPLIDSFRIEAVPEPAPS
jgi:hypothetical protein